MPAAAGCRDAFADLSIGPKSKAERALPPHQVRQFSLLTRRSQRRTVACAGIGLQHQCLKNTLGATPYLRYGARAWNGDHHSRAIIVREQHLPGFYQFPLANCQGRSKAVTIGTKQSHCRRKANSPMDLLRWLARDWNFQPPPNCRDLL
jgi:hypothetical protein